MRSLGCTVLMCCMSAFPRQAAAQQPDTSAVVRLEAKVDSLRQQLLSLQKQLAAGKIVSETEADLDVLLAAFNRDNVESSPEEQRSRRRRVDALLKAITERPGQLRFNGGATASIQNSRMTGGRFNSGVASFDIYASTGFGKNTLLFVDLEAIGGNGPGDRISAFSPLNGDAGSTQDASGLDQITVLEAWAEFTVFQRAVTIAAGKIDLTNYFDNNASANDETSQFLSAAFVNSAALVVPGNAPGVLLRTTLFRRFYVQLGISSTDNSGDDLFKDLYRIASVGFRVFPSSPWEANLRMYMYQHPGVSSSTGYGVSFDEAIAGAFNIFGRYTHNEPAMARRFGLTSSWSAGARLVRTVFGRRLAIGIAYGETEPHADGLLREKTAEVYVRQQLNKWVYISPHLQRITNPAGAGNGSTLIGVRTHFDF